MTQTHTGAYELAFARYVRVAMKTVMTALAWLYSYMCMYIGVCLARSLHRSEEHTSELQSR